MTDRELLEAAAKAAGMVIEFHHDDAGLYVRCPIEGGGYWNPLTDDGDALRLAMTLELVVDTHGMFVRVSLPFGETLDSQHKEGDPYAATRRAIVRAAAAMAKEPKP